jgi:hypothetical protein
MSCTQLQEFSRSEKRTFNPVFAQLAELCPNLVGSSTDGDIELLVSIRRRLGERLA